MTMAGGEGLEYPEALPGLTPEAFDAVLRWSHEAQASDVMLSPGDPIWMRRHGRWLPITRRVTASEIAQVVNRTSGQSNASALAQSGQDLDYSYEVQVARGLRYRFRCNATGCRHGWASALAVVMRTIPGSPPRFDDLEVESAIREAIMPNYGLVLVTGPVGSGKSTLLFSALREIAETQPRHIITYEAPIEFDLIDLPERIAPVVQSEIPAHLRQFADAPRNSLRRAGDVVLFGESRDRETMQSMSIEAETGVCVYSTVHSNSVSETVSRMIREFPIEERDGMAATLLAAMRLIVHQRLVPRADGNGRVPIREYLVFDEATRAALVNERPEALMPIMQRMVETTGQSLSADARAKYAQGIIGEREARMFAEFLN